MFGTLRNLANRAKAAFNKIRGAAKAPAYKYQGPPVPVITRARRRADLILALASARATSGDHPQHYPEWHTDHKPRGHRDLSQKQRSNRRKAAAKAHARRAA